MRPIDCKHLLDPIGKCNFVNLGAFCSKELHKSSIKCKYSSTWREPPISEISLNRQKDDILTILVKARRESSKLFVLIFLRLRFNFSTSELKRYLRILEQLLNITWHSGWIRQLMRFLVFKQQYCQWSSKGSISSKSCSRIRGIVSFRMCFRALPMSTTRLPLSSNDLVIQALTFCLLISYKVGICFRWLGINAFPSEKSKS